MSFEGRCGSLIGVALPLGAGVGVAVALVGAADGVAVGAAVGVEVGAPVGVAVGDGVAAALSTITTTEAAPIALLDESKPVTDNVCAPSGTEVESHKIDDGGDDAR